MLGMAGQTQPDAQPQPIARGWRGLQHCIAQTSPDESPYLDLTETPVEIAFVGEPVGFGSADQLQVWHNVFVPSTGKVKVLRLSQPHAQALLKQQYTLGTRACLFNVSTTGLQPGTGLSFTVRELIDHAAVYDLESLA